MTSILKGAREAKEGVGPTIVVIIVDHWTLIHALVIELDLVVKTLRRVCHVKVCKTEALRELLHLECVSLGFWGERLGNLFLQIPLESQVEVPSKTKVKNPQEGS